MQWQDTHHDHNHEHSQADHTDPHIWLLPETNLAIARLITKKLININPAQAKTYLANFERLANQLVYIDSLYRQAFHHRYLVLHDSYQYIERKYGLKVMGVLAIHADRPASIKTIRQAQQSIRQNQVTCILGEPPFQEKLIRVLLEGQTENKPIFIQLSPLADKFALTAGNYEKWQIQMVEKIRNCH